MTQYIHGKLLYKGTTAERGTTAPTANNQGAWFWDTDLSALYYWSGAAWVAVAGGGGATTALDNLAAVAINESLVSDTDSTDSIGSTLKKWLKGFFDSLSLGEIAAAPADVAGDGQVWVKDDAPNTLWFTDDDGTDVQLGTGGGGAPAAHKDSHDPEDGSDPLDTAAPGNIDGVQASAVGTSHSLARSDHAHRIQHSIADNAIATVDQADAADNDIAKFTADGLEGRSYTELRGDINVEDGADVTDAANVNAHAPTKALDNLAAVAINTDLVSDTDSTDGLGTTLKKWLKGFFDSLSLGEIAAAPADVAGDGQVWVKDDAPNTLWFTDDDGTDVQLGVGGGASTALDNLAAVAINESLVSDTDSTDNIGSTIKKWLKGFFDSLSLGEIAAAPADVAGDGQVWVKDDAPNTLWFTNDDGTDVQLGVGSSGLTDVSWLEEILSGGDSASEPCCGLADGGDADDDPCCGPLDGGDVYGEIDYLLITNNLSDLDNAATARTNLGVAISSDVLAYDAGLQNLAGVAMAADKFYYTSADNVHVAGVVTAAGRALIDDTTAANQRITLGLISGGSGDVWVDNSGDEMQGQLVIDISGDETALLIKAHPTQSHNIFEIQDADTNEGFVVSSSFDVIIGTGDVPNKNYTLTFKGETNEGVLTWMEDEDYFQFNDDVVFADTAGLYYGHMYSNTVQVLTITDTTPVEVTDAWTTGELNGVAFGASHYLDVGANGAGKYRVEWDMSIHADTITGGTIEIEGGCMIDGVAVTTGGQSHSNLSATSKNQTLSGHTILDLAANKQVSLYIINETNGDDIDVEHANLTITMIGGT